MANTTNFGWETPDDTDLVKDGAAAMRTLGNSIDASFVDLKGGTTGQILSKNSNTDLDYVWINNDQGDITAVTAGTGISGGGTSGAVTITNSMATEITAKGDLIVGTGSATFDNLPAGTNDFFLQAASGQTTGLQWGGTFSTYTPVLYQNGNVATSTAIGRYIKIGKFIHGAVLVVASANGSAGNKVYVTIPTAAQRADVFMGAGVGTFYDASSFNVYPMQAVIEDGQYFSFPVSNAVYNNGQQYIGINQFTAALASGDQVGFRFSYEVA